MPFMKGPAPVRRTAEYLLSGCGLSFRKEVKIVTINYNTYDARHKGIREFTFWRLPQIQYANPDVQIATFRNMTPTPFVRCFMTDGREMLVDVDNRSADDILSHLIRVIGKSSELLAKETLAKDMKENPANFGAGCERPCICEVPGQVPCPGVVPLPKFMRGKFWDLKQQLIKEGKVPEII